MLHLPIDPERPIIGAFIVEGDCQQPIMHDSDYVLVSEPADLQPGDTVVYKDLDSGRTLCKLYYPQEDGTVIMQPRNWRHHYELIYDQNDIWIIGKVEYVVHQMTAEDRGRDTPMKHTNLEPNPNRMVPILNPVAI